MMRSAKSPSWQTLSVSGSVSWSGNVTTSAPSPTTSERNTLPRSKHSWPLDASVTSSCIAHDERAKHLAAEERWERRWTSRVARRFRPR